MHRLNLSRASKLHLVVASIAAISLMGSAAGTQKQRVNWVASIANQPKSVVDKILGKPRKFDKADNSATYARPGFKEVGVAFYGKGSRSLVIEIEFKSPPTDWKSAMKAVGFDPSKLTGKRVVAQNGAVNWDVIGVTGLPKGWSVGYGEEFVDNDGEKDIVTPASISFFGPGAS